VKAGRPALVAACRAGLWGAVGTFVPALVDLAGSDWLGAGDLWALTVWTLPYLLILVVSGVALARMLAQRPAWLGLLTGSTAGAALGVLWTLLNALCVGPWFGAWSVPVLLCWTTGGALGLASAATSQAGRNWRRLTIESVAYLLVAILVLYAHRPAVVRLSSEQHLTLVYGRIHPQRAGPAIDDARALLSAEERQLLARAGIAGSIEILGSHAANTAPRPVARVLVLFDRPVDRVHRVLQPDATTVLYIQAAAGFRRFPPDAKVLERAVELYPSGPGETRYWIEHAAGSRSGGAGIQW
jgi:hypothetical protein